MGKKFTADIFEYSSGRNTNIKYDNTINYTVPATDLQTGTATGGSPTTISQTGAGRSVDAYVGKVIEVADNGLRCYGLITANSSDTIQIDDTFEFTPLAGMTFRVMNTVSIKNEDGNSIIALDLTTNNNSCAVVLPTVSSAYERLIHTVYIEKALDGLQCPVVASGTDTIRTKKNAVLIRQSELLTFTLHTFLTNHRDILYQENIRRFGATYWTADEVIGTTTYAPIGATANIVNDYKCRFSRVERSGVTRLQYNSLFPIVFKAGLSMIIQKTSGGNTIVDFAVRRDRGGVITDFTQREATARFPGNDIKETSYSSPVELQYGDFIVPIAKRDNVTATILSGSHFDLVEL